MRIGFFVQNYKRGGIDTFIKNLFSSQWKNDEIFIIYNKKNPGISLLKKKLKNVNFTSYSIFSLEEFINGYLKIFNDPTDVNEKDSLIGFIKENGFTSYSTDVEMVWAEK